MDMWPYQTDMEGPGQGFNTFTGRVGRSTAVTVMPMPSIARRGDVRWNYTETNEAVTYDEPLSIEDLVAMIPDGLSAKNGSLSIDSDNDTKNLTSARLVKKDEIASSGGKSYKAIQITSYETLLDTLSVSGSVSISGWGQSGSVSASYLDKESFDKSFLTYLVRVNIVHQPNSRQAYVFNPDGLVQPHEAAKVYGDRFIKKFVNGGAFYARVSIFSQTTGKEKEIEAAAHAVFSFFSIGSKLKLEADNFYNNADKHQMKLYAIMGEYPTTDKFQAHRFNIPNYENAKHQSRVALQKVADCKVIDELIFNTPASDFKCGEKARAILLRWAHFYMDKFSAWVNEIVSDPGKKHDIPDFDPHAFRDQVVENLKPWEKVAVKFCEDAGFKGRCVEVVDRKNKCINVPELLEGQVTSIQHNASVIDANNRCQTYEALNCQGLASLFHHIMDFSKHFAESDNKMMSITCAATMSQNSADFKCSQLPPEIGEKSLVEKGSDPEPAEKEDPGKSNLGSKPVQQGAYQVANPAFSSGQHGSYQDGGPNSYSGQQSNYQNGNYGPSRYDSWRGYSGAYPISQYNDQNGRPGPSSDQQGGYQSNYQGTYSGSYSPYNDQNGRLGSYLGQQAGYQSGSSSAYSGQQGGYQSKSPGPYSSRQGGYQGTSLGSFSDQQGGYQNGGSGSYSGQQDTYGNGFSYPYSQQDSPGRSDSPSSVPQSNFDRSRPGYNNDYFSSYATSQGKLDSSRTDNEMYSNSYSVPQNSHDNRYSNPFPVREDNYENGYTNRYPAY
ncbi:hypothetical protein CDD81_3181 [Ophiocordyceps australis]|uniref:Uncharacterized protein n=1 Tax=Ophiocordyceps australis TaxID=1399860 RepID=A0A2C5XXV3_9HYPO|nr:hypothetical protein CDD81_3181 [Ophiocordyceps australis]